MMNEQLKTILYSYANKRGLGRPLTAEQMLNAFSFWLTETLPDCIDVVTNTVASTQQASVTLSGNGTPENHYILTFNIPQGEQGSSEGFDLLTNFNLCMEVDSVSYDNDEGATVVGNGSATVGDNTEEFSTEFKIPIIGSEEVVVDSTEDNKKIQLRLDQNVTNKLAKALVTPNTTPTSTQLVGVNSANAQTMINLGSGLSISGNTLSVTGGGGGGETPYLYIHNIFITNGEGDLSLIITKYSLSNEKFISDSLVESADRADRLARIIHTKHDDYIQCFGTYGGGDVGFLTTEDSDPDNQVYDIKLYYPLTDGYYENVTLYNTDSTTDNINIEENVHRV